MLHPDRLLPACITDCEIRWRMTHSVCVHLWFEIGERLGNTAPFIKGGEALDPLKLLN